MIPLFIKSIYAEKKKKQLIIYSWESHNLAIYPNSTQTNLEVRETWSFEKIGEKIIAEPYYFINVFGNAMWKVLKERIGNSFNSTFTYQ